MAIVKKLQVRSI